MGERSRWRVNGRVYNIPEEKIDSFMSDMDAKGFTPEGIDDESSDSTGQPPANPTPAAADGDTPKSHAAMGAPEVIKGPVSVDDPDVLTVTEATTPAGTVTEVGGNAAKSPGWLDALINPDEGYKDPLGLKKPRLPDEDFSPQAWTTGALRGLTSNAVPAAARGIDAITGSHLGTDYVAEPLLRADAESERDYPKQHNTADAIGTGLQYRLLGGIPERLMAGMAPAKAFVTNVATQAGLGAGESAVRQYGDTGQAPEHLGADAAISALSALVPAGIGATADKAAANASTPMAKAKRVEDQANARAMSFGINPGADAWRFMDPDKQAEALAEMEAIAAARKAAPSQGFVPGEVSTGMPAPFTSDGSGSAVGRFLRTGSVQEHQQMVKDAHASAAAEKRNALAALAGRDARVDPDVVAQNIRGNTLPGEAPNVSDFNADLNARADRYDNMPRKTVLAPATPPPLPGPPPPPPLPQQIASEDLTPVRPAALNGRDNVVQSIADNDLITDRPAARYQQQPSSPATPDPVGALAQQYRYHVTPAENLPAIRRDGLLPRSQQTTPGETPYGGSEYPSDRLWLSDDASKDNWLNILAEDTLANGPDQAKKFVALRTALNGENTGFGQPEYTRGSGILPSHLEVSPEFDVNWDAAAGGKARIPEGSWTRLDPNTAEAGARLEVPGPHVGMTVPEFEAERIRVGENAKNLALAQQSNEAPKQDYAALMDAARQGYGAVDPELATRWDQAIRQEGTLNNVNELGGKSAALPPPPLLKSLGGLGATAGIGATLGGVAGPVGMALGAAGGLRAGQWYNPRRQALRADWLSNDSSAMMDRLSGLGRLPVGPFEAAAHDYMTGPADVPDDPDALPADTNSSASEAQTGFPPGQTLGRATTAAMKANPDAFMRYADDFNKKKTDDDRSAVVERLARTDPNFDLLGLIGRYQEEIV